MTGIRGATDGKLPRSHMQSADLSPLPAPFVGAVRSFKMIFVSAQSPVDHNGVVLHSGDIVAQTGQVMS